MFVRISDLSPNDMVRASWLGSYKGSEWHRVMSIEPSYSNANKLNVRIEGFGWVDLNRNDTIERQ